MSYARAILQRDVRKEEAALQKKATKNNLNNILKLKLILTYQEKIFQLIKIHNSIYKNV